MKRNSDRYYLAYGSNLNVEQMKWRCPGAKIIGTAMIENYRLMFKGSKSGSYLTIEPCNGKRVPVAVWAVTSTDEFNLDRYEGFPNFYYKKEMNVLTKPDGFYSDVFEKINAFVYIMHEDRPLGIPSANYTRICAEGYEAFGFDMRILTEAYSFTKKNLGKFEKNA